MKKQARKNNISLLLIFTALVFTVLLVTVGLAALIVYILISAGAISSYSDLSSSYTSITMYMFFLSLIIGSVVTFAFSHIPLRPVNNIINKMNRLASGDFSVRMKVSKPISNISAVNDLSDSFNKMAEELSRTEMLRSDFINSFSHEFKTPIVSISGFAKLLKRGNLSQEEQARYIAVIEEESLRLTDMATNMLSLSRLENQQSLSDIKRYNLSEQIRACVLLLQNGWEGKGITPDMEFDEYEISACEELLKQAWINLIDNAIKFANAFGSVKITITSKERRLLVAIANTGSEIAPENLEKVFDKFYQEDKSRAVKGNGIGLALVKRIVTLHGGRVWARSEDGETTFYVELPKEQ